MYTTFNAMLTAHYTGSGFVLLLAEGCSGQVCQSLLCFPKDGATEQVGGKKDGP